VVGGLFFSQLITLYLTPVVVYVHGGVLDWWRQRHARTTPQVEATQGALGDWSVLTKWNFSETFIRRPIATSLMMAHRAVRIGCLPFTPRYDLRTSISLPC